MKRARGINLRRLPSSQAQALMGRALRGLQRKIASSGSQDVPEIGLQDVQKACLEIENALAARGLLRNTRRLLRVFASLENYGRAIDVLCNGTPYLAWVWSPITVILRMASDCVKAFEIIMKAYTRIGETLHRFQVLEKTFLDDHRFQDLLAVFYADILQFHGLAYKFAQRSSWEVFLLTTCGRFESRFGNIIENLERHSDLIDKEGNVLNISETQKILRSLQAQQEENLQRIEAEEKQLATRQYIDILSRLQIDERDQLAIFDSLSESLRFDGTCGWALQQEGIASWLDAKGRTQSLWLHGSAGTGKSVLSAHLVTFKRSNGSSRIIHHFCSDLYAESKKYDQILRSIIRQLLQISEEATAHAHSTFLKDRKAPSLPEIERLVGELLAIISDESPDSGPIWVIVDGVDECEADKLPRLVSILTGRAKGRIRNGSSVRRNASCKVLFTSRRTSGLEKGFGSWSAVSLSAGDVKDKVQEAIGSYVTHRLRSPPTFRRMNQLGVETEEFDGFKGDIVKKADGMFLYARLILDYLACQLFTDKDELRAKIFHLPKTLQEFYAKLLGHIISHLDTDSRERVKSIFRWVAFAKRPLRRLEFLSAISFSGGNTEVCVLVPEFFLEDCANLVEVRHDKTISFIHGSVKEFLTKSDNNFAISEQDAISEQAVASLACLASASRCFHRLGDSQAKRTRVIKGLYGLAIYSSEYWVEYILSMASYTNGNLLECRKFSDAVETFVAELESPEWNSSNTLRNCDPETGTGHSGDSRLALLGQLPQLQRHLELAMACRSQDGLEERLPSCEDLNGQVSTGRKKSPDAVSKILEAYQETVRWLLQQDYYPNVLADDFESFKAELRDSTFTCRLRSCPRASIGFENEQLLKEHEWAHSKRPRCSFPTCHYPPFPNIQALKSHIEKYHASASTRSIKPLRRVAKFSKQPEESSIGWKPVAQERSIVGRVSTIDDITNRAETRIDFPVYWTVIRTEEQRLADEQSQVEDMLDADEQQPVGPTCSTGVDQPLQSYTTPSYLLAIQRTQALRRMYAAGSRNGPPTNPKYLQGNHFGAQDVVSEETALSHVRPMWDYDNERSSLPHWSTAPDWPPQIPVRRRRGRKGAEEEDGVPAGDALLPFIPAAKPKGPVRGRRLVVTPEGTETPVPEVADDEAETEVPQPKKRHRRTKAQIQADNEAAAAAAAATARAEEEAAQDDTPKRNKKWICRDPTLAGIATNLQPSTHISQCKACQLKKKYGAHYSAAAHLRRAHFSRKSPQAGGEHAPMSELQKWMLCIEVESEDKEGVVDPVFYTE